jgi:hypothetical protein
VAVVLKNEGIAVKHVSAKVGHLQAILEEHTNRDEPHKN